MLSNLHCETSVSRQVILSSWLKPFYRPDGPKLLANMLFTAKILCYCVHDQGKIATVKASNPNVGCKRLQTRQYCSKNSQSEFPKNFYNNKIINRSQSHITLTSSILDNKLSKILYYLLGTGESYGPTAQHTQDSPIFFIQLNHCA